MSSRDWREWIQDILDAIIEIETFTEGMDFQSFRQDQKSVRAVEMNFIIIGEAAASIPEEIAEGHPEVPWHLMRGMRNRLVHAYFAVDEQIMWDTLQTDIPVLAATLKTMLDSTTQ